MDNLCKLTLKLVQWFWRRSRKCKSLQIDELRAIRIARYDFQRATNLVITKQMSVFQLKRFVITTFYSFYDYYLTITTLIKVKYIPLN
jgi:hypothetical protein